MVLNVVLWKYGTKNSLLNVGFQLFFTQKLIYFCEKDAFTFAIRRQLSLISFFTSGQCFLFIFIENIREPEVF